MFGRAVTLAAARLFTVGRFAQSWATFAKEAGIGATSRVQLVVESRALRGRTLNFKPVATFDAWEFETVWIPGADSKRYPVGDDGTINVLADGRTIAKGLPSVSPESEYVACAAGHIEPTPQLPPN